MWRLRLDARQCLSCGKCADACAPAALAMRTPAAEAARNTVAAAPRRVRTFPHLVAPERCDGCMRCTRRCPTGSVGVEKDRAVGGR